VKLLVNAGPTREFLDSVRFISNASSGKMGFAISVAAAARGHDVILVSGPVSLPDPPGVTVTHVTTAAEMARACKTAFRQCRAAVLTAAVSDYRPQRHVAHKMAKKCEPRTITLVPTEDIAASLGRAKRPGQILIGFALEDRQPRRNARAKLERKNLDAILLNDPGNIGGDLAVFHLLVRNGRWQSWPRARKTVIARKIVRLAETLSAHL
jgi:phosphopantothenoylcysteine decarboxylase/phosphopantothenate--cysteine ligase